MSKIVVLDADLTEVLVILKQKGEKKKYTIREMTGDVFFKFLEDNNELAKVVTDEKGKVQIEAGNVSKIAGAIPSMLKHCLHDEDGRLVTEEFVKKLPVRVQQQLMNIAQDVNGLTEAASKEAGNLPTGSESGTVSPPGSTAPLLNAKGKQASEGS